MNGIIFPVIAGVANNKPPDLPSSKARRAMKPRKGKERSKSFVMLPRDMLYRQEWRKLSTAAKLYYIHLKAKYTGSNNGEIVLSYSELKGIKGLSSSGTISKAIKELEKKGWIRIRTLGGMYRHSNKYELTGTYDEYL
jgi:hypothetical protein